MPTRQLPSDPSLEHLKYQAKDLLKAHKERDTEALQRIREFHPHFHKSTDVTIGIAPFTLTDAKLAIAREYGFPSWTRLKAHVEKPDRPDFSLPHHERIEDATFRCAVDLLDSGDVEGLKAHLSVHPDLVHQRVAFEGGNYFTNPSLLEFVAENPIRNDHLPSNIVEVARAILDAGAKTERSSINYTLGLVISGRVPREHNVQIPLIDLLCDYGADPNGTSPAVTHGEFEAVDALIRRGAKIDLPLASAMGKSREFVDLLPTSTSEERHLALAHATQHGRPEIVRLLLEAGEDPNRFNPQGAHSHSTPLHQAALTGNMEVVRLLVQHGARLDTKDILFHSNPLGWAEYSGQAEVAEYLKREGKPG